MKTYPIMLNLIGRRAVVVGGGPVGLRKARSLIECGAEVMLVTPADPDGDVPAGVQHVGDVGRRDDDAVGSPRVARLGVKRAGVEPSLVDLPFDIFRIVYLRQFTAHFDSRLLRLLLAVALSASVARAFEVDFLAASPCSDELSSLYSMASVSARKDASMIFSLTPTLPK